MKFLWKSQLSRGKRPIRKKTQKQRQILPGEPEKPKYTLMALWLLLLGTLVYTLVFSPFLLVDTVRVSGTSVLEAETLEKYVREETSAKWLGVIPKNNFLLLPFLELEGKVAERFPLVKDIAVERSFPRQLALSVSERERLVVWCAGGPCYLATEGGRALEGGRSLHEENRQYLITVIDTSAQPVRQGQLLFDFDLPSFASKVEPIMRDQLNLEVGKEYLSSSRFAHELRLRTSAGYAIYISTDIPIEKTARDLALLFEKELPEEKRTKLEYIDARTENRIFYRLAGESIVSSESSEQSSSAGEFQVPEAPSKKETKKKKKE